MASIKMFMNGGAPPQDAYLDSDPHHHPLYTEICKNASVVSTLLILVFAFAKYIIPIFF